MQRVTKDLPLNCEIVFAGDTHYGSRFTHEDGIAYLVDYVASKENRFMVHMGDWIEAIMVDDKRFDPKTCTNPIPLEQAADIVEIFRPIRSKLIVGLCGNHERKIHRFGNIVEYICDKDHLNIPYGTQEARIIFTNDGQPLFNMWVEHRNKRFTSNAKDWEQRQANKKSALKLYLSEKMGDCAVQVCGHAHWLAAVPPSKRLYLVDNPDGVKQNYLQGDMGHGYINPDQRWYGCSGSFYKAYVDGLSNYGSFPPNELGFLSLIIDGGKIQELREIVV
jgi:predicted phosphodiesterase